MSFARLAFLGALSAGACAGIACSGTVHNQVNGSTSGGGGSSGMGGGETTTATATTSTTSTTTTTPPVPYPGPFPTPPQVVTGGGPKLTSPKFVPVFFSGDDMMYVSALTDFDQKVGTSKYWATAVGEYGVGPGMATPVVALTETAPATIDDSAIQTWLAGKLNGNDPAWPTNDANTVYVLHYPASTVITYGGSSSCQAFGGYHSNITLDANHGSADAAYAVIPRCTDFPPLTGVDAITGTESHELAEASTDPYPNTNPAYYTVDNNHYYWSRFLGGGEVGDMCAQFPNVWNQYPDLPYTVQSIWSNANAKAGHDPCQPSIAPVYFNAAPVMNDTITVSVFGQSTVVKGVKIPVGMSATIDVELFSDGPTSGPWSVGAKDAAALLGGTADLSLSLDKDTGVNGDKLKLTIKVMTAGKHNTEMFYLTSKLGSSENIWVGIVGN